MIDIKKNNLEGASSPYLRQHGSNPIWWQEWSREVLDAAVRENKPLFVSVGYATCHWCHVMAAETFSDRDTADYLNSHFICIKVDREQRPDIDQFMMRFLTAQSGSGGWPLNVFLTPKANPIYALTYAQSGFLLNVAEKIHAYYENNADNIQPFTEFEEKPQTAEEESIIKNIALYFDHENSGFGNTHKFPPHSTLLYLLYYLCVEDNADAQNICVKTLDAMQLRGLNDHLQGGIFRYCVDPAWTIPHFEKMLYDQAMALWCYSLAYKVIGKDEYRTMAQNIMRCLDECFDENGLFISAFDADTLHSEGRTYIWTYEELEQKLTPDEFKKLRETYDIEKTGNFEGHIHLIRKNGNDILEIENKLLQIRRERAQPGRDSKVLCGINALTAAAMINAGRNLGKPFYEEKAARLIHRLVELFWDGKTLGHSYFNGQAQKQGFLFDAAAMLAAISMLCENDPAEWSGIMNTMAGYTASFKEGEKWVESRPDDFRAVDASWFDSPIPSSVSLAEMGMARADLLTGKEVNPKLYRQPLQSDFYNIACMITNGLFHVITSKNIITRDRLTPNTIQRYGEAETDCYKGTCSRARGMER